MAPTTLTTRMNCVGNKRFSKTVVKSPCCPGITPKAEQPPQVILTSRTADCPAGEFLM